MTIPNSVTYIGTHAFSNCGVMLRVNSPRYIFDGELLKDATADKVVSFCKDIKSYRFLDSETIVGDGLFYGARSLETVIMPESMTKIGKSAFEYYVSLKNINIPDGVTDIGWSAFADCHNLREIRIPDGVRVIYDFTFADCWLLENLTIGSSVTGIGTAAFAFCDCLKSVTLPPHWIISRKKPSATAPNCKPFSCPHR